MSVVAPFDPWKGSLCTCPKKYSASPYTGCAHGCLYCYITAYIPNAFNCRPKKEFVRRLQRDLKRVKEHCLISMANSSDPYSPPEEELLLTRRALEILLRHGFRVQLVTKSHLVVRDLDIISSGNCGVAITITTVDDGLAGILEPNAPSPSKRLEAVRRLATSGVPCAVRLDPIIPNINDKALKETVEAIASTGASHVVASTYKAKPDSFERVSKAFPALRERLRELYWVQGEPVDRAHYLPKALRLELLTHVKRLVEDFGMTYATCREGFPWLVSGGSCDGGSLIPDSRP